MRTKPSGTWVHPHPAAILLYSLRQVLLLLIPIVRAFFSILEQGWSGWNEMIWVDLLAIGMMFLVGFLRYLAAGYQIKGQGIAYKSGLIFHKRGYIPFSQISVTVIKRSIWFRPLQYCSVYIDTDAGGSRSCDFAIDLSLKQADALNQAIRSVCRDAGAVRRICRSSAWEILFLSFLASDSLSGILFLSAAISGLGDFLSVDIAGLIRNNFRHLYRLASIIAGSIPPAAAWAAYILLLSWFVSFAVHAVSHLRFTALRKDDELKVKSGVFSKYVHIMKVSKINLIEIRQTLLTKLIGIRSVFVQCCGYGKIDNALSVLLPGSTDRRAEKRLSFLLPEFVFAKRELKPKPRYIRRMASVPLLVISGCILLTALSMRLFSVMGDTILFMGFAITLPAVWYLLVRLYSYHHNGAARVGDTYTFSYTYGYRMLTTAVKADKITRIQISQSFWQRRSGGCDLLIYTRCEKRNHIRIQNLTKSEVDEFFAVKSVKREP